HCDLGQALFRASEHDRECLFGVAAALRLDFRIGDVGQAGRGTAYIQYVDAALLQTVEKIALDCRQLEHIVGIAWVCAADSCVLINPSLAIRHAVNDDTRIMLKAAAVHAGELAVRTLIMHPSLGSDDLSFEHNLRIGWHE